MSVEMLSPFAAKQPIGVIGILLLCVGLAGALLAVLGYGLSLRQPENRKRLWLGRAGYALAALGAFGTFSVLAGLIYFRQYQYHYVFSHTSNDLHGWFRFAATWAGQEGSFLLWAAWTALIGFLVLAKAGKYEARVMPFYVTIIAFLCVILLKQSPFLVIPAPSAADLAANPDWRYPPIDGRGLNPSLVNYWMTIHPPTIFFGFASLAVPYCYALAALFWKDYEGWLPRVMPYSLLSCVTLGVGLFMGGYWAYETQGWHGFWAWDPVENASFFPWLAITAFAHGAVVQRSRGGMARTNLFLALFAFWLFLVGTFLTRSGALAAKDESGQLLSVHAFDNIGKSALSLMAAMLIVYGLLGLGLWLARLRTIPTRPTVGESPLSRDLAFVIAVATMLVACLIVMFGTTQPLFQSWLKMAPSAPKPAFYNKTMLPLAILTALGLGGVPWLAWRKTNPDTFLRKLLVPWIVMLVFSSFLFLWVLAAERSLAASMDMASVEAQETLRAWISPQVQRVSVILLCGLAFLAMLSNAMLAYRVFRAKKPLAAGGWLAHVGIGLLIIGCVISNTYERVERFELKQGEPAVEKYGYTFEFEKMTGTPRPTWPLNPDYDQNNAVQIRVTPPRTGDAEADQPFYLRWAGALGDALNYDLPASVNNGQRTFLVSPRWFAYNLHTAQTEKDVERMRWPYIKKYLGHDLYVGFANDPQLAVTRVELRPGVPAQVGDYSLFYLEPVMEPGKYMAARIFLKGPDGGIYSAQPGIKINEGMREVDVTVHKVDSEKKTITDELLRQADGTPAAIYLRALDATTKTATVLLSLPGQPGQWSVALEVTFKPWVNLVWIGVIIAALGTFLAMLRRAAEARKLTDSGLPPPSREVWEMPAADEETARGPFAPAPPPIVTPIMAEPPTPKRKGKLSNPKTT